MSESIPENATTRLAHVLFMDIVGYSKLPIDQQAGMSTKLKEIVRRTEEVRQSPSEDQLISLFTGDGLALVFFGTPLAPVKCAVEINQELRKHPEIKLRMGVHSGLVELIRDVNEKLNVAGGGINTAQRIMDCGDGGHILLSERVADDLKQYSRWQTLLHDLGETKVKHEVSVNVFNLYSPDVGNSTLPAKFKKGKPAVPIAVVIVFAVLIFAAAAFLVRYAFFPPDGDTVAKRTEADFAAIFERKRVAWVERMFSAQAANGGIKTTPSSDDNTVQVWATAQCIVGAVAAQNRLEVYGPRIRKAFEYIEATRRVDPTEGWNLYGGTNPYTITDIGGWVTLAYIHALDSRTAIWNDAEKAEIVGRIERDLAAALQRQNADGGLRPIKDDRPGFTRTYSTAMILWSLLEARKSQTVYQRIGNRYDENIRMAINWLLRTYKEKQGWLQNPNRMGQVNRFDGLTAQILFVLRLAENIDTYAYLKGEPAYKIAKSEFVKNKQFASWSIDKDNSSVPDGDGRFPGTEFHGEGSTFLWFPWTLAELSHLAVDESISPQERADAAKLRLEILNANHDKLESYVETADFIYLLAENLYCASSYLNSAQTAK